MYKDYININVHLNKNQKIYIASFPFYNRIISTSCHDLLTCLFKIKSRLNIFFNKNISSILFTYLYFDNESKTWLPFYTDIFNRFIQYL